MKAWIASILLAALCFSSPGFADTALPAEAQPSQEQVDAAMDLLRSNNTAANMQVMLATLLPLQIAGIRREHPNADDETIKQVAGIVNGAITAHSDDLMRLYAIVYARHFSVDELHTLSAFYRSGTGQKYINELPTLIKEATPVGIAYLQRVIAEEVQKAIADLRSQGVKI